MKFEENVKDFLKVIDFDLCIVDEKSVTIHDKYNEESLNYILNFPIDFTSDDNLRVFRCNESNKNYTMEIMNTKDPKHQFIKNGIEMFRLMWSNGMFPFKEDDIFSAEIFHHDSLYISFIGRSLRENHVSYRKFKHGGNEYIDVLYRINSEKRKFEIIFNVDKTERRIFISVPVENKNQAPVLCVEENKKEVYRQELKGEEIENYMYSLFYKAGKIIMETHEGLQTLDSAIFDKVFDYYDIAKEFINILHNSKDSNEVINEIFKKYFDSTEFEIDDRTLIKDMHKITSKLTPEKSRELVAEREEFIKEKMREIEADEDYDEENESMNLEASHYKRLRQIIREDFEEDDIKNKQIFQGPMRILKRSDTKKIKHMKEMIRKDFEKN